MALFAQLGVRSDRFESGVCSAYAECDASLDWRCET
jgi:hypothetical protein